MKSTPAPARGDYNRFVAFAFAAAEMVTEVDEAGIITYAAGAFRSRLDRTPESLVGASILDVIAPCDHDMIAVAMNLLRERGRLLPCVVRLSNAARTHAVLAGLRGVGDGTQPLCITLGLPPLAARSVALATTAQRLMQHAQGCLSSGAHGCLALLEVASKGGQLDGVAAALDQVVATSLTSEVAPGRFGILDESGESADVIRRLEEVLRRQGIEASIAERRIELGDATLTPGQAGRAMRQAVAVFARDGTAGMDRAGFGAGLARYVENAICQARQLGRAIEARDFGLQFQPIVALGSRQIHHYEALIRPARGMADHTPQEFVTLVETAGLSNELDLAVARMVCEEADRTGARIAVNISGQSAQDPAFRERLLATFSTSRAAQARRLLVELTETAQIEAVQEVATTAKELRELGIRFCIDDFGAGSADIRLLRSIPTDIVKLDGSFVAGIVDGGRERAFVAGMIEVAHAAGTEVVAEHIETEEEAAALAEIGASFGQGWLFGHPAALPEPSAAARSTRRQGTRESWG